MSHLPWSEVQAILIYCEKIRAKLNLSHWDVGVGEETSGPDTHAQITAFPGKHFARVEVAENWMDHTPQQKRTTLLHEMLHILHAQTEFALKDAIDDAPDLSKMRQEHILQQFYRGNEYMVDGLTKGLALLDGFMPMWPSAKTSAASDRRNGEF